VIDTDISKFGKIISIFSNIDIPYDFENDISVYLKTKYKNFTKLMEFLIGLEYCNRGDYYYINEQEIIEKTNKYPDEICWDSFHITFEQLCNLPEQIYEYIDIITFSSNDYGSGPIHLKTLYDFCNINECNPNDEDTEHSFNYEDTKNSFYSIMHQKIEI
jgi:hypothetical protein